MKKLKLVFFNVCSATTFLFIFITTPLIADPVEQESESLILQYRCHMNGEVRTISVNVNPGPDIACETIYDKGTGTQTLWSAKFDQAFCLNKSLDFVSKQVGWGFHCFDMTGIAVPPVTSEKKPNAQELVGRNAVKAAH